jgi:hypothetical protein
MRDPLGQLRLRFSGLNLRNRTPHGQVYAGTDFTGAAVTVAVLAEDAANDPEVLAAFRTAVRRYESVDAANVHSVDVHSSPPWVALREVAGQPGAGQFLDAVANPAIMDPPPPPAVPTAPAPGRVPDPGRSAGPLVWNVHVQTRQPRQAKAAASAPVFVVVALMVVSAMGAVGFFLLGPHENSPSALVEAPAAAAPSAPATTGPPVTSLLRDVPPVSLIGPVWQPGDDTYTMALPGWPFAFRTPTSWSCSLGVYEPIPEASAWQCLDASDPDNGQRVNVILWECPTTCTSEEQAAMVEAWLDEPDRAVAADATPTWYVETERNIRDRYAIDLSHFVSDPAEPDGPLRWHVGVYLESPPDTSDAPLKVLNDIITQTS